MTGAAAVVGAGKAWPTALATARGDGGSQGYLVINGLDGSAFSEDYVDLARRVGVNVWHRSVGGLLSFADAYTFASRLSDKVRIVRSVTEMEQARSAGKLGIVFGWQSANTISTGRDGPNDFWQAPPRTELRAYYELGLRICGIAYQIANVFGGGAMDGDIGLSRAGHRLVEEIHKLGIVLDIGGHTGDHTSRDALEISKGVPVICSHGNVRALANNSRNLPDSIIEGIAKTGGVIGIAAINDFVVRGEAMAELPESPLGTTDDMLRHAEYIRDLVGIDHVGLGPDFTVGLSSIRDRALFGPAAMDLGPRRFVAGFGNIGDLPLLVAAMQRRGWPKEHIDKCLGGNWQRVYRTVMGG